MTRCDYIRFFFGRLTEEICPIVILPRKKGHRSSFLDQNTKQFRRPFVNDLQPPSLKKAVVEQPVAKP